MLTIELDSYGFMLDTQWAYIALSWQLLATTALLAVGYKYFKKWKNNNDK